MGSLPMASAVSTRGASSALCRVHDPDALIAFEVEQVCIAGDDEIGSSGQCTGEHGIVTGIIWNVRVDVGRNHLCSAFSSRFTASAAGPALMSASKPVTPAEALRLAAV